MGKANFTEDFKRDAVRQIIERGYSPSVSQKTFTAGALRFLL